MLERSVARADLKIAWILMKRSWNKTLGEHVPDYLVGGRCGKTMEVTRGPLPKRWVGIFQLIQARKQAARNISRPIERILQRDDDLTMGGNRTVWNVGRSSAIIRNYAEYALIDGIDRRRSICRRRVRRRIRRLLPHRLRTPVLLRRLLRRRSGALLAPKRTGAQQAEKNNVGDLTHY